MESKELRVISKMVMNFTFHFRYNYFGWSYCSSLNSVIKHIRN
jgi:hypothetical protein